MQFFQQFDYMERVESLFVAQLKKQTKSQIHSYCDFKRCMCVSMIKHLLWTWAFWPRHSMMTFCAIPHKIYMSSKGLIDHNEKIGNLIVFWLNQVSSLQKLVPGLQTWLLRVNYTVRPALLHNILNAYSSQRSFKIVFCQQPSIKYEIQRLEFRYVEKLRVSKFCSPWRDEEFNALMVEVGKSGNDSEALTLQGFLAKWAYMTFFNPVLSLAYIRYLGYEGPAGPMFNISKTRKQERNIQQLQRKVVLVRFPSAWDCCSMNSLQEKFRCLDNPDWLWATLIHIHAWFQKSIPNLPQMLS